jgi:DNA-binding MarR family transcriptional regulator
MVTEPAFDETIHAPIRLRICGLLRHVDQIDFAVLRDSLGLSDTSLSKHLKVLLDAGYVSMTKSPSPARSDARRLTWIKQTRAGRHAFDAHMEELRRIAVGFAHGFMTQQAAGSGSGPQPPDDPATVTSPAPTRPGPSTE